MNQGDKMAPKDHIASARLLLAGIEADLRQATDKKRQAQTAGADHFQHALEWAQKRGITESNVDAFSRELSGLAESVRK
jgi:hypothetical protein